MSRLPKGFSSPSIASTSQEGQMEVKKNTLFVTLLSSEWRSSTSGDTSTINRELAIQLAKHPNVQVSVFLPQCSEEDKSIAASHKVQLIEAERMTAMDPVDWLINVPENHVMDCIIGHGVHLGRHIPLIQRSHDCKWIQVVHSVHEELGMYKSNADAISSGEKLQETEIELCERADQVVAVGPKLADAYKRYLRSAKNHQNVLDLTPSIFSEFLDVEQATEERKTFCVLVIGSGDSEDFNLKGYDLAAQAIAELKEKSYQLRFICAPGGKGGEIAAKLLKHGITRDQLIVRSFNESREMLARLFCEVDLAIMPSRTEGFGLAALEALSAGLPVLLSGNSGLGEALKKVPTGSNCVVDSEDPKDWAKEIRAVRQKDREVRLAESKHLREKYLERYRWQEPCGILVEKMQNLVFGSPGHDRPQPSSVEYGNLLPFTSATQTPTQTYQTSHTQVECSQLPIHAAMQQYGEPLYLRSHHPQSSPGWLPSSVEYSQFPSAVASQAHEGPSYQRKDTQSSSGHGRPPSSVEYHQLPFAASTHTLTQTYQTSHTQMEHSQFPLSGATETCDEPVTYLRSYHPQKASPVDSFDVKTCQRKLTERYQKTAKVPTTVWSSVFQVDLDQIYTRLSWVKEEQTTAGSSKKELSHYTELFTEKTKNGAVPKRILVQGDTGIGKTTFVKKLLVDWSNLEKEELGSENVANRIETKMDEKRKEALRKFELVLSINLKEVSKCQTLREIISRSRLIPIDEETSIDDLLSYIRNNQENVLLVFDGYDEYRTGSEAEEKYGSRSNSPICEILHGDMLRDCTVLVTTRSSRADEIRGPSDVQAEITGFNMSDRKDFMRKMLESQTQVDGLLNFLRTSKMEDLARVPLLNLFFCLLWKEEKEKLMELTESKTKLFRAIMKHILQHSHKKHSASHISRLNEENYQDILAELGKVALAGLLKGDLMFEFDQLPEKVRGKESIIVGLLQLSEYGPSLEPMEMVSFIHKSIQEYLAAWYITYRCIPEGSLGGIEQHARTLEDCQALENVFQFICGLSADGAVKVFQHLSSVRISDPTLDLSMTIPDEENERSLCDVTDRRERFSDLVYNSFREVRSKAELLSHCLECTGGVVLVTEDRPISELVPQVKVLTELAHYCVFRFKPNRFDDEASVMYKSLEFLNCLQMPLTIPESSKVLTVRDLLEGIKSSSCSFSSILCLRKGQFQLYMTKLSLQCDDYARLFIASSTDSVPSVVASLSSEQSCLKFLSSLDCYNLSGQTVKALSAIIRNCRHLSSIEVQGSDDSICDLLEQVSYPSKCSLTIGSPTQRLPGVSVHLTSAGAVSLANLLPRFNKIITLSLDLSDCCSAAVDTLVSSITDKNLRKLKLSGVSLTPAAAAVLGRLLPEMLALEELELIGVDRSILQAEEMEALFGSLSKTLPLYKLTFSDFSVRGCLAPLTKSFRFFSNLRTLKLENLNMDEHDLCGLLESLRFIRSFVTVLNIRVEEQGNARCCSTEPCASKFDEGLNLEGINLTPTVAAALGRSLAVMSFLKERKLTGVDGSILQTKEMEMLFGGLNKFLRLREVIFTGFNVQGCLTPLIKNLCFFPYLRMLHLEKLNMAEHNQCSLVESLQFIPNLTSLSVQSEALGQADCGTAQLSLTFDISLADSIHKRITTTAGVLDGGILQSVGPFGGFHKTLPFSVGDSIASLGNRFHLFPNLTGQGTAELNKVGGYTHKARSKLLLSGITLTPVVSAALGRSLPEMSSLKELKLTGVDGSILKTKEMEALFGKLSKTLPLCELIFSGFSVRGCLTPLFKSLRFFPDLRDLKLEKLNMDEHDQCSLIESLTCISNLSALSVQIEGLDHTGCCKAVLTLKSDCTSKSLNLDGISLSSASAAALGRSLPEMLALRELELTGVNGSVLQAEEIAALFDGCNKTLALRCLTLSGLSVSLAPLSKSFRFLPNLRKLNLGGLTVDEHNLCGLLESLRLFIPNLKTLSVKGKPLSQAHWCTAEVNTIARITPHKILEDLNLDEINLTPAVAAALGRLLPEMSSLKTLELAGVDGSILQTKEMRALFGGFNKTVPLSWFTFSGFSVTGCLAPLTRSLKFFPNLRHLKLEKLNMDEHDLCGLLESCQFVPDLWMLDLSGNPLGHAVRSIVPHVSNLQNLRLLELNQTGHSKEDFIYVRDTVQQTLPQLKISGGMTDFPYFNHVMCDFFSGFSNFLPRS